MGFAILLIVVNIAIYATLASPAIAILVFLRRVRTRRSRLATVMILVTAELFAPAFVGVGHFPVIVPFAASGFIDQYEHGLLRANVLAAALTTRALWLARRRLLR